MDKIGCIADTHVWKIDDCGYQTCKLIKARSNCGADVVSQNEIIIIIIKSCSEIYDRSWSRWSNVFDSWTNLLYCDIHNYNYDDYFNQL